MSRTVAALVAVLLAAAYLLAGSPAHAADPIPGPIDEVVGVPSQIAKSATGSPLGDVAFRQTIMALRAAANQGTTPPPVIATTPKPITAPGVVARGSSAVGAAFFAGWALTDGVLAMYGATTGTEPMGPACSLEPWVQGALSVMYVFSMPDCAAPVSTPNSDQSGAMTYEGRTFTSLGRFPNGSGQNNDCFAVTGAPGTFPSSAAYALQTKSNGVWPSTSPTAPNQVGLQPSGAWFCGWPTQTTAYFYAGPTSGTAWAATELRVVRVSDGVVVASEVQADPSRAVDCKLTFPDGSITTATGYTYTEGGGINPRSISTVCQEALVSKPGAGPDLLPTEIEVGSTPNGGTRSILTEQTVPEYTPDERKGLTSGNGHGLVLSRVVGTVLTSCMTWEADCAGWWESTDEGTVPGTYRCTYAGAAIALTECGVYRHSFESRTATPTITDPTTGEQIDWSAQPNTGNSLNPGVGPGTGSNPSADCFATGWSSIANPVDWVMVPVKCALVWAFVPRTEVVTASQTAVTEAWEDTGPGKLTGAMAAWTFVPPGGGCSGLTFSWEAVFGHNLPDWNILNACPGSPLVPAAIASNIVLTLGSVLGLIYALTRFFGGTVGFGGLGGRSDN